MIPPDRRHVELVLVVETDGPHRAPRRRGTDAAAGHDVRVTQEGFTVWRKGGGVVGEGGGHVVAFV